jgi:hypothetical protein
MDTDDLSASNTRVSEFSLAGHGPPVSKAQLLLGRHPRILRTNEGTVVTGGPAQPAEGHATHTLKYDKVAIPRGSNPEIQNLRKRVSRACGPCREQKTKCGGQRPECQRCRESNIACIYTDRKRERDAKFSGIAFIIA